MVKIEKGDYLISDIYQGGYSSLDPSYGSIFTSYNTRPTVSQLGVATDPRVANVLKEVSDKIAPGAKNIELSFIQQEVLESVPKQHLKEVKRLSELTGVDVTLHAPLVEASGLTERSGFSDLNREIAERQMTTSMEKAHELSPDKGTPVTFHSAAILPSPEIRKFKDEETGEWKEEIEKMLVIEQESGQIVSAKKEEKYYPEFPGQKIDFPVEDQVSSMNETQWSDSLSKLVAPKERIDRIIADEYALAQPVANQVLTPGKENLRDLKPEQVNSYLRFQNASQELGDVRLHLKSLYNKAYKYGSEKDKRKLKEMGEAFSQSVYLKNPETGELMKNPDLKVQSAALQRLMHSLNKEIPPPELFKPLNEFAFDKSAQTFGNVAYKSYKKFGENAPIVSIENPPTTIAGFSRGSELKELVKGSREKFVEKAVSGGMSKNEAEKQAEKMIGVTWDVGHINQLRRFGFSKEDIVKETEEVAPYIKHIHLSDNFGNENVELPMGMGDVPLKEMMEKVGDKASEVKQIVEAGHWWQHFRTSPMAETFEALGSPIYSMRAAPYWNQAVGLQQGYFSGYGQMLPPINYETFGSGFSRLPIELGGQRQGAGGSRMGGTPME